MCPENINIRADMDYDARLDACPFCGRTACVEAYQARKGFYAYVQCDGCPAAMLTVTYDTKEEAVEAAIAAWNRRAAK